MLRYLLFWCIWANFLGLLCPSVAHAYLDPGTGSVLVSALVGVAATFFFVVKSFVYKLQGSWYAMRGVSMPKTAEDSVVIYSEGAQYWRTFQLVVEALLHRNVPVVYLTSATHDPAFDLKHPLFSAKYIGQGNRAFAVLNMLEAKVCILTTPGLDVLQIKRSRGVKHYAHIMHAVTDAAFYKLYAFDYYDSVLCSGQHQITSIRHLEALRGTPAKLLLETGSPYIDSFARDIAQLPVEKVKRVANNIELPRLLIAPTWGKNGLLFRFGLELLLPLAQKGYPITLRPHPQTLISEPEMFGCIQKELTSFANVHIDLAPSGLESMLKADVLISDLSGIVFDFAFLLQRPVVTIAFSPNTCGQEAGDLPWQAWELDVLPLLGKHIEAQDVTNLDVILQELPNPQEFAKEMIALRDKSIYNFGVSAEVAAEQLIAIHKKL